MQGGKGHQLIVGGLGVLAGEQGQSCDRVLVDPDQPCGLADAAPLGQVLQDGQYFVVRELGVEQRGALELGKTGLASVAVEKTVVRLAEVVADREVADAALTVTRAVGVLAAEAAEVVRGHESSWSDPAWRVGSWTTSLPIGRIPCNHYRTPPETLRSDSGTSRLRRSPQPPIGFDSRSGKGRARGEPRRGVFRGRRR